MSGVKRTTCKHGIDLTARECEMCASLWEKRNEEEEFIQFFQRGIDTIAGQRHKIRLLEKKLEHALNQSPIVRCHGCDEQMSTCASRTRTEHTPFGMVAYRAIDEVQYWCKVCGHCVWVAKLKGTI